MAGTIGINKLPIPNPNDPDNVPYDVTKLASAVDDKLIARFISTSQRDAAIPNPISGQLAAIPGTLYFYDYLTSAWRTVWDSAKTPTILWGSVTITPSGANVPTSAQLTFSQGFKNPPVVLTTASTAVPGSAVTGVSASSITAAGCLLWVTRTNTTGTVVQWVAIGN